MTTLTQAAFHREVGRRIGKARNDRGWTQKELAARLGYARTTVGQWEAGCCGTTLWNLHCIARVLGVDASALIPGSVAK